VLPSLNLIGDLGNQQSLRFSLSKIMARPTLNDMRASSSFGYDQSRQHIQRFGRQSASEAVPRQGADLSYEKYWDNKAYVSGAVFYRKLDTYIINTARCYDFTPRLLPTSFQAPSNIGIYTAPVNGTGGNIKGVELAASLPFNLVTRYLDGFGLVVNGSQNSSAVSLPNTANGGSGTMDLPGLSKRTASLTVYYEKNGFSARAAERYRSDFIGEVATNTGDRELTYIQGDQSDRRPVRLRVPERSDERPVAAARDEQREQLALHPLPPDQGQHHRGPPLRPYRAVRPELQAVIDV
jgi:iron complex outermembrane receptor protein